MKFNEKLKDIRLNKNLTQRDVYQYLNISANGYASWEQGRTEPNIEYLYKICLLFDVSADYLLGLENYDGTKTTINNSFNNIQNSNIHKK